MPGFVQDKYPAATGYEAQPVYNRCFLDCEGRVSPVIKSSVVRVIFIGAMAVNS